MDNLMLEAKTIEILERVVKKQPIEDSAIELKREWPIDHPKTARQIAGHANSSRGDEIIWIIGVDDDAGEIIGANKTELANWFPSVEKQFNQQPINLTKDLAIHYQGKTVVTLLFQTDRFPYVVKSHKDPNFLEVPWRVGTRTSSATRENLVQLLAPKVNLPEFETVIGEGGLRPCGDHFHLYLNWKVYNATHLNQWVTIPLHKCSAKIIVSEGEFDIDLRHIAKESDSSGIDIRKDEMFIGGPGALRLFTGRSEITFRDIEHTEDVEIEITLPTIEGASPILIRTKLDPKSD